MLKEKRHELILKDLDNYGFTQVSKLKDLLSVTDMTVRRDLKELEEQNLLIRVHGGAKSLEKALPREFSNEEKMLKNKDKKEYIGKLIANTIKDGEIVFLGAGTTIEYASEFLEGKQCRIYTNSLYLFNKLNKIKSIKLNLVGGEFREITGAFVGSMAIDFAKKTTFSKAFIGVNGIDEGLAYTYSVDEGLLQEIILDNAKKAYIIADSSKIGRKDFYSFYEIKNSQLISDKYMSRDDKNIIKKYTKLIN
ncbi:MAG: DeoR/GlpR family DNA-binding transcription regulator [Anaerococcus sp.]|nr:DeoR/GlpR family DNA-binding transcription regulator [Anaerococcus sp.]